MKKFVNVDKEAMEKGYAEMGIINLGISELCYQAENEGEMISEMVAKEGYSYTEGEQFGS